MSLENGYLLNQRYRILDVLGKGGMGAVYRAVDENLDTTVAVKENAFLTEEYARQFQREAKILASLRHPNLPRVFDYFVIDQQGQYLVMDYIEGDDLRQWMTRELNISEIEVIQIGIKICDALIYLHSRTPAITHRDIKPGNIKITPEGEIVLVDFGLVKLLDEKELTTTAARAMTPGYSPPEQYGDAPTDHRSDIFSLGATLYAALAGFLPEDSLARSTGKAKLTPLKIYCPQISQKTARVIEKALNLRFDERWQSPKEFKDALVEARETIPKADWFTHHLAASTISGESENEDNPNLNTRFQKWLWIDFLGLGSKGSKTDPVWLIFWAVIILLLVMLGFSLVQQENLSEVFVVSPVNTMDEPERVIQIQTTTLTPFVPFQQETQAVNLMPTSTDDFSAPQTITPSPTLVGGGAGLLAFVSERTGSPQIWLLDVPGGESSQISFLNDGACQPNWSPDGERIVFTSPCQRKQTSYPGSSLFILDLENGNIMPLPSSLEGDFDPAWSPDGDWIAYTSVINGQKQLYKIKLADLSIVRLSDGSYEESNPAWSPTGDRLAFVRVLDVGQIWLMDSDGGNALQFSRSDNFDNTNPAWYPDENLILFSQALGRISPLKQLRGMRLEDIGEREEYPIIPGMQFDYTPFMDNVDVSPDGYWLAFDFWHYQVLSEIYIMNFPGANLIQMTDHPAMDYYPVWRPKQ